MQLNRCNSIPDSPQDVREVKDEENRAELATFFPKHILVLGTFFSLGQVVKDKEYGGCKQDKIDDLHHGYIIVEHMLVEVVAFIVFEGHLCYKKAD